MLVDVKQSLVKMTIVWLIAALGAVCLTGGDVNSLNVFSNGDHKEPFIQSPVIDYTDIALPVYQSFDRGDESVSSNRRRQYDSSNRASTNILRNWRVYYLQDFEEGWRGWTTRDNSQLPMWHLSQIGAYGNVGYSWWMADQLIAGYKNAQYTYLDTPEIMVTEEHSRLTFNLNYRVQNPSNWVDPNNPEESYTGWDGFNVRISTNNGETWNVISGFPEYNSSSLFSFGRLFSEGPNVPGWSGNSDGWRDAAFDLSNYIGRNVRIRFAFASDETTDSVSNPELFGVKIDNIALGEFIHNFNDGEFQGMTFGSRGYSGGDLWHIGTTVPAPPSPFNAIKCQNDRQTYNQNMHNYLISPPIELPDEAEIRVDFLINASVLENVNQFPNCNYFGFEVSPNLGQTWYAMSNPYGQAGQPNYVYILPEAGFWFSFTEMYEGITGVISDYAGEAVQFRVSLKTNNDQPQGNGVFIDNFTVYYSIDLPSPTNLTATLDNGFVNLNWEAPDDEALPDGYNVYRTSIAGHNYQRIGTINDGQITTLIDRQPLAGNNYYIVRAIYDDLESDPSNEAHLFVFTGNVIEVAYDDGFAESGHNVGNNNRFAVRFEPEIPVRVQLTHIKFFIETRRTGAYIPQVWLEGNGLPGVLVAQFIIPSQNLTEGWNIVQMPAANPVYFTDETFYIGFMEAVNASAIGLDENNSGNSITKFGNQQWQAFGNGNFMIRAILTIEQILNPLAATNPTPENNSYGVALDLESLNWEYYDDEDYPTPAGFRVYFDDTEEFGEDEFVWVPYVAEQVRYSSSSILPEQLDRGTVYCWKVIPTTKENGIGQGFDAVNCPVWHFITEPHLYPAAAVNPYPYNFSMSVSVELDSLRWFYIDEHTHINPLGFRVYFNDTDEFGEEDDFEWVPYVEEQTRYSCSPILPEQLDYFTNYYWLVIPTTKENGTGEGDDAIDCPFWSFRTEPYPSPVAASNPYPGDNSSSISVTIEALQWDYVVNPSQVNPSGFRVYFNNTGLIGDDDDFEWVPYVVNQEKYSCSTIFPAQLEYDTDYYWLVVPTTKVNGSGQGNDAEECPVWSFATEIDTNVDLLELPLVTELKQNYPNPFNPETVIAFSLSESGLVSLEIFDIAGRKIRTLVVKHLSAGNYSLIWDGKDDNNKELGSGVYLYKLRTSDKTEVRKMIMIK